MSDIFREVDEEYRQEQLVRMLHANAPRIIALLVIAIVAAGGYSWWTQHKRGQDEAQTFALYQALEQAHDSEDHRVKPVDSRDIMIKAGESLTGGRKVAAQLSAAHYAAEAGDTTGALSLYDAVIAEHGTSSSNKALAELASLDIRLDSEDPAKLSAEIDRLAADDSAWRFSARELQGLLAMRQGDFVKSKAIFSALADDKAAPEGLRQRAASLATVTSVPVRAAPAQPADGKAQ
jgi:hypothetical protein